VRPLEQGLPGGEAVFFGDAAPSRRPRAFNGQLSVISKRASEYLSVYLPHVVLTLSGSRAVIHWFFSLISECLLLSCCAKRQITAVILADV
jgi:hypothetical protein